MEKEKKEEIVHWAFERFRHEGIRNVTMDVIASHAGISKRTLYEQFGDKEQLLIECLKYNWAQERQALLDYADQGERNILELILFSFNQKLVACRNTYPEFIRDVLRYRRVKEYVRVYNKNASHEFVSALRIGIEQGLMRSDIRFELFEEFFMAQLRFFYEESVWRKYTPQEVFRLILLVWLRGIATEEGEKVIDAYMTNDLDF